MHQSDNVPQEFVKFLNLGIELAKSIQQDIDNENGIITEDTKNFLAEFTKKYFEINEHLKPEDQLQ